MMRRQETFMKAARVGYATTVVTTDGRHHRGYLKPTSTEGDFELVRGDERVELNVKDVECWAQHKYHRY